MNEITLGHLREVASNKLDATGAPLPDDEVNYFRSMLNRITETETGCWSWQGSVRDGSPEISWPGCKWGAMVKRKVWRLVTGTEPGDGDMSLARLCSDQRCVRPHPNHVVLSGYRKGGATPGRKDRANRAYRTEDRLSLARAVHALLKAATRLRSFGVDPHEFACERNQRNECTALSIFCTGSSDESQRG